MLAQVSSAAVLGVDGYLVRVEVDISAGLPCMSVVGLPESSVREGRERVSAALQNTGFRIPSQRITVNLAPADVPKGGSAFDLPIAVGILAAAGAVPPLALRGVCFVGELGLDGDIRPVRGSLSMALCCAEERVPRLLVPWRNRREAAAVPDLVVLGARTLSEVMKHLRGERPIVVGAPSLESDEPATGPLVDFSDVRGQGHAKRALEVAAAGGHNVLLVGAPGAGKSMLARRVPGILPPLTRAESVDVTRIHSVAGRLRAGSGLVSERPFRAPHHTTSQAGLIGGGSPPRPGEASLAHHGVLFLDELPEFRRPALEALRQPLEDGSVQIGRARHSVGYPARFMLVAAMNPCPCGYYGDGLGRCTCHPGEVRRYRSRISGPLLDRIDIHLEVAAVPPGELTRDAPGEGSSRIRARVVEARARQLRRFSARRGVYANAHMGIGEVRDHCRLVGRGQVLLDLATRRLGFSGRAYQRVLKVARTIADLEGSAEIDDSHVAEAIQYRTLDRRGVGVRAAAV